MSTEDAQDFGLLVGLLMVGGVLAMRHPEAVAAALSAGRQAASEGGRSSDKTLAELAANVSSAKRAKAGADAHHHDANVRGERLSIEKLVDGVGEGVPTIARAKVRAILERRSKRESKRLAAVLKSVNGVFVRIGRGLVGHGGVSESRPFCRDGVVAHVIETTRGAA